MIRALRNLVDFLEDFALRRQIAEGEELAFEIEEHRRQVWQAWEAVNTATEQLVQGTTTKNPADLAAEIKQHARELERGLRQSAILLLEAVNRLEGDEGEPNG